MKVKSKRSKGKGQRPETTSLVVWLLFSGILRLTFPSSALPQDSTAQIEPILRLEKPKYILGESIRFWVGVRSTNSAPIPQELRREGLCKIFITNPGGNTVEEPIGWPMDYMSGSTSWYGGWGLGQDVRAGTYALAVECAGQRKRLDLIVEENEIFNQIKAGFRFERSGAIKLGTSVPVNLAVDNESQYTILFPQRGAMGEGVSIRVTREEPAFLSDLFYPWEKLSSSSTSPDTYTWKFVDEVPSVVLKPGEHFEQRFLLEDAHSFDLPGNYTVAFSTVLPVLVGEEGGPFTDFCPIRFAAGAVEKLKVAEAN